METEVPNEMYNNRSSILVDNSIQREKLVEFKPVSNAHLNETARPTEIDIPAGDAYYLPSKSFLQISGRLVENVNANTAYAANAQIALINNAMMYLFSNVQYWLGGKLIETINYPGQTTSMLGYLSYPDDFNSSAGLSQCWRKDTNVNAISSEYTASRAVVAAAAIAADHFTPQRNPNYNEGFAIRRKLLLDNDTPGEFSFNIPFSHIFGFAEYDKVLYNLKHTLKLTRESDGYAIHRTNNVADGKIVLSEIRWLIPEITPSVEMRTELLGSLKDKTKFPIHFCRRYDEHARVPNERSFFHNISTAGGIEKPRWIIVGFQTDKTTQVQNPAVFDHLNMTNAFVKLGNNSEKYPDDATNEVNFTTNKYVDFYNMTDKFKREHYEFNNLIGGTQIDMINYKKLFPLVVFDVRRQSERVRNAVMNIMLGFKFSQNVPANTSMYVVIISDRVIYLSSDGQTPNIVE